MQHDRTATAVALALGLSLAAGGALGQTVRTRLEGYQEVPAASRPGSGEFKARIDKDAGTICDELEPGGL